MTTSTDQIKKQNSSKPKKTPQSELQWEIITIYTDLRLKPISHNTLSITTTGTTSNQCPA
ncbi:unnamed protein product, partial [Adineta ricciae]